MTRISGKKVKEVRRMTDEEMKSEGWIDNRKPCVLVFEDGTLLYASGDTECNYAGALVGMANTEQGQEPFGVLPHRK